MTDILLEGTAKTPEVKFSTDPISMSLSGRSIPENSIEFYKPLLDWVDQSIQAHRRGNLHFCQIGILQHKQQ